MISSCRELQSDSINFYYNANQNEIGTIPLNRHFTLL